MKISPARIAAFDILLKIEKEQAFSSILLPQYEAGLSGKDRALTHELVLGVLRKKLFQNLIIENLTGKNIGKFDAEVIAALQIGLYQINFLDKIPVSAAVNESVNLVVRAKKTSAKGLVNAVLRKSENYKFQAAFANKTEEISVMNSHPLWLVEKWKAAFGIEETEKLASANNQTPAQVFRLTAKSDKNTISILKKLGNEFQPSEIAENAFIVSKHNDFLFEYAKQGKIYFQDESSQLVANAVKLSDKESFSDICAAPGSKTTLVTAEAKFGGFTNKIAAGDLHFRRVKFLKENCVLQGGENVGIVCYNAENALPYADVSFDCVLTDVPCSGTGTIRHNPEIRYFLKPEDFADLQAKQLKILRNASKTVKSGGKLIYSACSLESEENETVIEKFLRENPNFKIEKTNLPEKYQTSQGFVRTFPQRDETDGFFIAQLRKT